MTRGLAHPYGIDGRGRTAMVDGPGHLRDLIELVLFTAPGERVMRPDFGSGLGQLVFEPGGPELAGTVQLLVQGSLGRWLGHLIAVDSVIVRSEEGVLDVSVTYTALRTGESDTAVITRRAGS